MPEEHSHHAGGWLRRITGSLTGEPRDLEDLNEVLAHARERGIIDSDAHAMFEGVLRVVELQVRDIMVPRSQMIIVNRDDPPETILPLVVESGHSRYPVIGEDRDQIVGVLLAKDLLRYFSEGSSGSFDIKECLRPAVFIPESKRLNVLLKEFRISHHHMAIVVDEYGGVSGLVTIEDVLEQIVGDIGDEYDTDDDLDIRKEGERQFTVKAQTRIDEFNDYFGTDFSDEEFDTIGGLAISSLGRLPRRGESFSMGGLEFKVLRADRRRLDLLRVITPRDIEPQDE
ncbi:MAG TPA: transporter associated domain-containing protein [Steroidobacter sp.]|uniref:HlyC/CorC family transporter n=1 Tax=Steroidobacter sp. TaxID=1978227 RepID=UPI002ED9FC0A